MKKKLEHFGSVALENENLRLIIKDYEIRLNACDISNKVLRKCRLSNERRSPSPRKN